MCIRDSISPVHADHELAPLRFRMRISHVELFAEVRVDETLARIEVAKILGLESGLVVA